MSDIPSPISATEKYLSKMAGSYSGDLPSPVGRDEIFMYYAAINSGGGGSGDASPLTPEQMNSLLNLLN